MSPKTTQASIAYTPGTWVNYTPEVKKVKWSFNNYFFIYSNVKFLFTFNSVVLIMKNEYL